MITIGECMKNARKRARLSRAKLSKISGIGEYVIYNAERDYCSPRLFTITCLADALKISIDEYIGRTIPK